MKKCENCGIILLDPPSLCPLCKTVVTEEHWNGEEIPAVEPVFPYADRGRRRMRFALNIYTYAAIVVEILLCVMNLYLHHRMWWTILVGGCMVYGYFTLRISMHSAISHKVKIAIQSLLAFLLVLLLDGLLGYRGWALNYVYPFYLAAMDISILILMFIHKTEWQSYIFLQIMVIGLALVPFALRFLGTGLIWRMLPFGGVLFGVIVIFAGTIVLGGTRARSELRRRFHM